MNECIGLAGKLFGHKFKTQIEHIKPPQLEDLQQTINRGYGLLITCDLANVIDTLSERQYIQICVRCGKKYDLSIL